MDKSLDLKLNIVLLVSLLISLVCFYLKIIPDPQINFVLIFLSLVGTSTVAISALSSLIHKKISVDLLASIALIASLLNREWAGAVFINLMITSARIFGDYTEDRARNAIKSLLKLRPSTVKIKKGDEIITISLSEIKVGDIVVIESGDRIPIDGVVVDGTASIDQSSITGESMPITKTKGQQVLSSTLNTNGSLIVKTEKVGRDTTFEKIIALVTSAQSEKVGIQTMADKFATIYISSTLIIAIVLYLLTHNLVLILSLLLVACADDIAIAIPLAFWASINKAAKKGIIIKGASYLEGLAKLKKIMVDKTGTLTRGKVKLHEIFPFGKFSKTELLNLISDAESVSEHPIAKAITEEAKAKGIKIKTPEVFTEYTGRGILAKINKHKVLAGSLRLLKDQKVKITNSVLDQTEHLESEGYNIVYLAIDGKLAGLLTLADQIRSDVKTSIEKLKSLGVKEVIMLTGDNEQVAQRVAREVGVTSYFAGLLPEKKLEFIKKSINKEGKTAMVGDGVNDAAALTAADIGIAMGVIGTDTAIESADIALMKDKFSEIVDAVKLSRYTTSIAKQNFLIWGAVNAVGIILVFAKILNPETAAAYNFATDFIPLVNSLRVLAYRI